MRFFILGCLLVWFGICWSPSHSKEIELTKEWQRVEHNDTVPAGGHIRMDMTTGEKWAKLMDDKDDSSSVEVQSSGQVETATIAKDTAPIVSEKKYSGETKATTTTTATTTPDYDYDMMYRTLSQLPLEEQERMGGLPELPGGSVEKEMSPEARKRFEARMREIWEQRQAELAELQEELMVDLPDVLKDRIERIQKYLQDPYPHLVEITQPKSIPDDARNDGDDDNNEEDDDDDVRLTDFKSVLEDLEFLLTDVDMARDFHTLGGWPLLVSLVSDEAHGIGNHTWSTDLRVAVHEVQAHAAWAVGTTVKNTGEFIPYTLEPIGANGANALSILFDQFQQKNKAPEEIGGFRKRRQKLLYALGSLLRGNRAAQEEFVSLKGPASLEDTVMDQCPEEGGPLAKRILALAGDIVSDMDLAEIKPNRNIRAAFTTTNFCQSALDCLRHDSTQETALRTIQIFGPDCAWRKDEAVAAVQRAKEKWVRQSEEMDPEILRGFLDLADETKNMIQNNAKK